MRINYNVSAMLTNNTLAANDSLLSQSLQRLSSGLKINNAKDNPAGLAMAKRMNAQIEGISVATQNASDGVSIIEIADGALAEIQSMVQRMNELAVKACNGTLSDAATSDDGLEHDRDLIQKEIVQLKEEIERIAESTEFNGQKLLNGEFDLKSYTSEVDIKVQTVSDEVSVKKYTIDSIQVDTVPDPDDPANTILEATVTLGDGFPDDAFVGEIDENKLTIKADNGFEMVINVSDMQIGQQYQNVEVDVTGIGAMRLQIGSNEGQILPVRIPQISLENMKIQNVDYSTEEGAKDALTRMNAANDYISSVRSRLGAYQNRLESTISSLDITSENMTAAYSRIMDVDMAEEMTNYTTYQILTQAGTSMLAQANERPSQVLQLLQ